MTVTVGFGEGVLNGIRVRVGADLGLVPEPAGIFNVSTEYRAVLVSPLFFWRDGDGFGQASWDNFN